MELAVFGTILIFMLGVIIRQSLGFSYQQHQSLKAMRRAMLLSNEYAWQQAASRNLASVLIVEDRLGPGAGKYGAIDRTPYFTSASASHSNQLFQPIEGEPYNLPMFDMFINGQHFPFRTAMYKIVTLNSSNPDIHWRPNCVEGTGPGGVTLTAGCAQLYAIVANFEGNPKFCWTDQPGLGIETYEFCDSFMNLHPDQRFDLDRSGLPLGADPDVIDGGAYPQYKDFAWQWIGVAGFDENYAASIGDNPKLQFLINSGINLNTGKNVLVDIDDDLKEERIIQLLQIHPQSAVIEVVRVIDRQEGDLDFSFNSSDTGPRPGLTNDVQMYTFVRDLENQLKDSGTYLLIEEGQLFATDGDTKQYVRSVQKKDSVDLIERVIQLSNDTNRFCDKDGLRVPFVGFGIPNPVEVCCNAGVCQNESGSVPAAGCFDLFANRLTCMEEQLKMIFVRSRVQDLHGRTWLTDVSEDDYVEFDVPEVEP